METTPNTPPMLTEKRRTILEYLGLVLAVLAIIVSVVLAIRAEHDKGLTIRYLAQRPLLTMDPTQSPSIRVTYQDRPVLRPYLLSARMENSGDLPIVKGDIEAPLTLRSPNSRVLGVQVSSKHPTDLEASITNDSASVILASGLLNPGDWLSFDVLFDGDPGTPILSGRVSGVSRIVAIPIPPTLTTSSPTYPSLSKPLQFLALLASSLLTLGAMVLSFIGLKDFVVSIARRGTYPNQQSVATLLGGDISELRMQLYLPEELRSFFLLSGTKPEPMHFESLQSLHNLLTHAPPYASASLGKESTEAGARFLYDALRDALPPILSQRLYELLPSRIDQLVRERIADLTFSDPTLQGFLGRVRTTLSDVIGPDDARIIKGWSNVDRDDFVYGSLFGIIGVFSLMTTLGAWRLMFSA